MPRYLAKYYFWIRLWSAWLLEPGHWTLALGLRLLSSAFLIRLSDLDWKYSTDFPGFMVCRLQSGISQPPQSHKSIPYNRALSLSLSLTHFVSLEKPDIYLLKCQIIKFKRWTGGVAQQQSICLASVKSWIQTPVHKDCQHQMLVQMWSKCNFHILLRECKMTQPFWEKVK
jgi:hypothetical protein